MSYGRELLEEIHISTEDEQFINDLADRLCQMIYDARLEYKRMKGTKNE